VTGSTRRHIITLVGLGLILFGVLSALAPATYPTPGNIVSMAFQMSEIGILALAIGVAFVIGGLDLSIVAVANLSAITAAFLGTQLSASLGGAGIAVAVVAALAVGVVAGLINGLLVSRLRIHPIVITLGTLTLFQGIGTGLTGGSTVFGGEALEPFGRGQVAGIPVPFLLFVVLAVGLTVATTKTRWGYRAYMVGASERAARFGQLPVERIQIETYMISGLLASTAGLVILARTSAANVSFGGSYLILAILVAVVAGMSPFGGEGRLFAVVLAMIAMQQVATGLNIVLSGWDGVGFLRQFAWGVLLIGVLGWSQIAPRSGVGRLTRRWWRELTRGRGRTGTEASEEPSSTPSGDAGTPAHDEPVGAGGQRERT